MADFSVEVVRIAAPVTDHPNADRLSLIQIGGYLCISAKLDDGSHRYEEGDLVVYVPEASVVPEYILKPGFWDEAKGKGILAGSKGDRVKAKRLRDIFSQGILLAVEFDMGAPTVGDDGSLDLTPHFYITNEAGERLKVEAGDNVAEFLGITKYEPPVPACLAGEVCNIFGKTAKYDFESIQRVTDLFEIGEDVIATEKIHGTNSQIGYVPGLNHEELFFDGNLYIGSKGLSAQGLVMKNNEKNKTNTYVLALTNLLDQGFGDKIKVISDRFDGAVVRVFSEIYGKGIQDLSYGTDKPTIAAFDIQINGEYVAYDLMVELATELGIAVVPTLYEGPYDLEALIVHRDGIDTISQTNVREGIVIKARNGGRHVHHGRKIGKWVSPAYLERKNATEHN
jgi:RNA ligase (TIGR02306 family)